MPLQVLRHQPGRERRPLRLEADAAAEADRAPGNRIGRPAGTACGSVRGHADRGRDHRRRIERFRLDRAFDPRHVAEAQASAGPAPCCRRSCPRTVRDRASPAGRTSEPQRALAGDVDRAGGELALNGSSRPSGPFADDVEPRRLAGRRRRCDRARAAPAAGRPHRPPTGRRYELRRRSARRDRSAMNASRLPVALAEILTRMAPSWPVRPILPLARPRRRCPPG